MQPCLNQKVTFTTKPVEYENVNMRIFYFLECLHGCTNCKKQTSVCESRENREVLMGAPQPGRHSDLGVISLTS